MTQTWMLLKKTCMSPLVAMILLFPGSALPCPLKCHPCSPSVVRCEHISSLAELLTGLPNNTEKIILHRGNLTKLPSRIFARFSRLHFLSITGSLVKSLTDLAFSMIHGNNVLKFLDLSRNHLHSCMVEPMAFSGLLSLRKLILSNNSLDVLRKSWFSEMPLLQKLFLGANRIAYLPPRMFENLTQLDELVVSSNLIQYLPMDAFYGMPLLTKLDLSSNRILFINHEVFQALQALKYLLLFQNQLTLLPVLPSSITFLFLHENPWECTCQLVASMASLMAKIQTPNVVTCNSPPDLEGHQVVSTRPEGCIFPSSSLLSSSPMSWSSPVNILNLSLLYGFLGGLLLGSFTSLLCCCCCFPKCCPCFHSGKEMGSKKTFPSYCSRTFSREGSASNVKPRVLCSFPVVANMSTEPCCGLIGRSSRTCSWLPRSSADLQKPLVAVLSLDATGSPVATLHEQGWEMGGPVPGHACHQTCHEGLAGRNGGPRCRRNGGSQEPRPFSLEDALDELPIQKATPDLRRRTGCASGRCVNSPLGDCISHSDVQLGDAQPAQALAFPHRSATEAERNQGRAGKTSSKRSRSWRTRLHLRACHQWSAVKGNRAFPQSQSDYHRTPRLNKASDERQRQEGFVGRRRPNPRTRNGESPSSTDTDAKVCPLSVNRVKRKRKRKRTSLHGHRHAPNFAASSSSSSSSSSRMACQTEKNALTYPKEPHIEKQFIFPLYGKKEESSPTIEGTPQVGRMPAECWETQKQGSGVDLEWDPLTTKDARTYLKYSYKKTDPPLIAQKAYTQQSATPKMSRRFLEGTTQPSPADCDPVLAWPSPYHHAEHLRLEEPSPLRELPVLRPPFEVPPHQLRDVVNPGPTDKQPSAPASPLGFPVAEKTTTVQLILKTQHGCMDVVETEEMEAGVGPCMAGTLHPPGRSIRILGEEQTQTEGAVGQDCVDVNQETVSSYSNVMRSDSYYDSPRDLLFKMDANVSVLQSSHSPGHCSDVQGDLYEEVATTVTSQCPLLQKMCQINFSLGAEEEKPSK